MPKITTLILLIQKSFACVCVFLIRPCSSQAILAIRRQTSTRGLHTGESNPPELRGSENSPRCLPKQCTLKIEEDIKTGRWPSNHNTKNKEKGIDRKVVKSGVSISSCHLQLLASVSNSFSW